MPKSTFAMRSFGSHSMLSSSIAGPVEDLSYWAKDFTSSTPDEEFEFEHALHNMDPEQFRNGKGDILLFMTISK